MPESKKRVILLTNSFPYGKSEPFLSDELKYLSEEFEWITIVPVHASGIQREIPKNIEIIPSNNFFTNKFTDTIKGLFTKPSLMIREFRRIPGKSNRLTSLYYILRTLGIAARVSKTIIKLLADDTYKKNIIYSYWLNQAVLSAYFIKNFNQTIPIIARAHGYDIYEDRYPFNYIPFQNLKIELLDQIHAISNHALEYLLAKYPKSSEKTYISRLGVGQSEHINHPFNPNKKIHFCSCSSVIPLKRVEFIAQTMTVIAKSLGQTSIIWTHIGDGENMSSLKELVKNIDIKNLTINLEGYLEKKDILNYYIEKEVDFFINFSTTEGVPVSIMEALSCGIPIIAPKIGGIPEILDSDLGLLVDVHSSINTLSEQIIHFVYNCNHQQLRKNAIDRWEQLANSALNYKIFVSKIKSLLE